METHLIFFALLTANGQIKSWGINTKDKGNHYKASAIMLRLYH
jgi:hypothetical protein